MTRTPESSTVDESQTTPSTRRDANEAPGRKTWPISLVVLAAVVAVIPLVTENNYYFDVVIGILLLAAGGGAWNLLGGYTGQISLGHAGFFGLGGYVSVLLFTQHGVTPWIGIPVGGLVAGMVGLLLGGLTLRLRGPFFVLATIAFAQVLLILAINLDDLTGGSPGVSVPFKAGVSNMVFDNRGSYVWLIGGFLVLVFGLTAWIETHRLGAQARAVRESRDAAESLGINSTSVKLQMTAISSALTGIVGGLSAYYIAFIDPSSSFGIGRSIDFVLVAIIGGMGTVWGPILGAILIQVLHNELSGALGSSGAGLYLVVYGVLMIVVVLFFPKGIVGGLEIVRRRIRTSREGRARV